MTSYAKPNFVSIGDQEGFLAAFTKGSNGIFVSSSEQYKELPISFRGITKRNLIRECWDTGRTFYFMDTGYFGNYSTKTNPKGVKRWHRIIKNNVQHIGKIEDRPNDRWNFLQEEFPKLKWPGWKKEGNNILLVTPSEKPCKFYGIDLDKWLNETIDEIKKYTNRKIIIRKKPELRIQRTLDYTIYDQLDEDIFSVVTYNSIAATEAVAYGIPAFTLAPNAASSMCLNDLSKIETPYYPDYELVHKWCCYLSYGQFNNTELIDGTAWRIFNEYS